MDVTSMDLLLFTIESAAKNYKTQINLQEVQETPFTERTMLQLTSIIWEMDRHNLHLRRKLNILQFEQSPIRKLASRLQRFKCW